MGDLNTNSHFSRYIKKIRRNPYVLIHILANPQLVCKSLLSLMTFIPFKRKLEWDALVRPNYAYGIFHAAQQAKSLNLDELTVMEFGVFTGQGLTDMEWICTQVSKIFNLKIEIYGFDTGQGMPEPVGYKDMPYVWRENFFKIDIDSVKKNLKSAKIILGDVSNSVSEFVEIYEPKNIGFISFDLDYYSSTIAAFKLFDIPEKYFIPRVYCYFDDIIGDHWELHSNYTGELLAIKEFNLNHDDKKIVRIYGLRHKRKIQSAWNDQMFVLHLFKHSLYNNFIHPSFE